MKRVLMVAYHFPPMQGSSGIQRTLRFVQHLPKFGWEPIVLSAHPMAYESVSDDLVGEVPSGVRVERALAFDAARHLKVAGRYMAWTARPDRWMSWRFDAVRRGKGLIRRLQPDAIWSTYPIATAHVIGNRLRQSSGLPWIADFRDPMAQDGYPADPVTWAQFARIEKAAMDAAGMCVFTTPGAARTYRERYPNATAKVEVIENGYDEESFAGLPLRPPLADGPLTLLHSGIVYPSERDPTCVLEALSLLKKRHGVTPQRLRMRFRAPVHDELLRELSGRLDVSEFIEIAPNVRYREALSEMTSVGALLILQAGNCNEQIPAKLYEYLRAGRPIVGFCDPKGDTSEALRVAGVPYLAPLDNAAAIADVLLQLLQAASTSQLRCPSATSVAAASRLARAEALAALLEQASRPTPRS